MMNLLRWVMVPVAGITIWYAVLLLGLAGVTALDWLCPPELVDSGMCMAPWHAPAVEALILICTAAVSVGIVMLPALVAPARRFGVAMVAYGCGAAFAVHIASSGSLWGPVVVSGVSGSAALWLAASRWRKHEIAA